MSTTSSASSSDASIPGTSGQLQTLAKFQQLYHSYRRDKDQEADSHTVYAAKLRSALAAQERKADEAVRHRQLTALSSSLMQPPAAAPPAPSDSTAVRQLLADMELKSSALKNVTQSMSKLQSEVHVQQAREDEIRAEYQRQVGTQGRLLFPMWRMLDVHVRGLDSSTQHPAP